MAKKYLITSALPYVNGELHLGHLVGCYLPSDVYARFCRAKGR
ncbi:MAG: class I tRNA ligase family protein, partial [Alphaproteobacteria bacterium]|nr:class I tRNA ligase family protein [Alphaproteobacteria bacterium]